MLSGTINRTATCVCRAMVEWVLAGENSKNFLLVPNKQWQAYFRSLGHYRLHMMKYVTNILNTIHRVSQNTMSKKMVGVKILKFNIINLPCKCPIHTDFSLLTCRTIYITYLFICCFSMFRPQYMAIFREGPATFIDVNSLY